MKYSTQAFLFRNKASPATNRGPIDITITDVVTGDPLHT